MIKITYYVGTNDKDTLKPELFKRDFIKVFDELFKDYTLIEAIGKFTNKNNKTTEELSLVVTTFIEVYNKVVLRQHIQHNCSILKERLNQESILVEMVKPEIMFI
jgi:hypothetical protein